MIGNFGLIAAIWLKPNNVDAHTHHAYEVLVVAKEGHTHVYSAIGYSLSINNIRGLDSQIKFIMSERGRGIYGAC